MDYFSQFQGFKTLLTHMLFIYFPLQFHRKKKKKQPHSPPPPHLFPAACYHLQHYTPGLHHIQIDNTVRPLPHLHLFSSTSIHTFLINLFIAVFLPCLPQHVTLFFPQHLAPSDSLFTLTSTNSRPAADEREKLTAYT